MFNLQPIFDLFKIKPKSLAIYEQAFTHPSYSYDHHDNNNYERLEFLGDVVISKIVSEHLYTKHPDMDEGMMSKARTIIVQSKTQVTAAKQLNFLDYILIGGSVKYAQGISDSILEDVYEAFIGAVYLDQGERKCFEILKRTIIHYYEIHSLNEMRDFKSMLQEILQRRGKVRIRYHATKINNGQQYRVEVLSNNVRCGSGIANKIKDAEMLAAKDAYYHLSKK
jgi:ribonuclease-3